MSGGKAVSAVLTTPVKLSDNQIFTLEFDCFVGYQGSSADAKAEITDSQKELGKLYMELEKFTDYGC